MTTTRHTSSQLDIAVKAKQLKEMFAEEIKETFPTLKNSQITLLCCKCLELELRPSSLFDGTFYKFKEGAFELKAHVLGGLIVSAGYRIQIVTHSEKVCCLRAIRDKDDKVCGEITFTLEQAQKGELTNSLAWRKYPKDMLYARALSRLGKQVVPHKLYNCYAPGELQETSFETPIELKTDLSFFQPQKPEMESCVEDHDRKKKSEDCENRNVKEEKNGDALKEKLELYPELKERIQKFLQKQNLDIEKIEENKELYQKVQKALKREEKRLEKQQQEVCHG